jgi:predicted DNA-binding transcriptional regulator AlpA
MAPRSETLTNRELMQKLGITRSTFFRLKAEGRFDHLKAPVPQRFSVVKVDAFLHGRSHE